jgi:hypothetical protein
MAEPTRTSATDILRRAVQIRYESLALVARDIGVSNGHVGEILQVVRKPER